MSYKQVLGPLMGSVSKRNIDFYITDAKDQVANFALLRIQAPGRKDWKDALDQWNRRLKALKEMKIDGL